MCFISRWRVVCLFVVASLLYVGCLVPSNPEESCNNGINRASIDPTGFACKEDCECNNQQFIAKCQEGADGQKKCVVLTTREPCSTKGRKEYCFLEKDQLPPNLKCFWGVRTCQDTGLQILNWGDCRPPNTKDIDEKKALETKLAALNNDPNQLSKEDQEKFRDYCTDGIDNDCDGQADYHSEVLCQGFCKPGEIRLCYGEDATQQVPSFGICRRGQQVCTEKYTWGPCQNFVAPTKEVCDKQDNDCNGKIDDVAGCTPPSCL